MRIPSSETLGKIMDRAGNNPKARRTMACAIYRAFWGETVKPYFQKLLKERTYLNDNGVEELSIRSVTERIDDLGNPVKPTI